MLPGRLLASFKERAFPWRARLAEGRDGASLAAFRIAFGLTMAWHSYSELMGGSVARKYLDPDLHFPYPGFEFLQLSDPAYYYAFIAMTVSALFLAAGFFYRLSTFVFGSLFTVAFLSEMLEYQNHYYLMCLVSGLLVFIPAHRLWSVDNLIFERRTDPHIPAWSLWILRFQMGVVYFFGGLAKLNPDWLKGQPVSIWLHSRTNYAVVGPLFQWPEAAFVVSYGGLLLDLFIVGFLLWRKTRVPAFFVAALFHVANANLFSIGVFPAMGIAATSLFLSPSWPRRIAERVGLSRVARFSPGEGGESGASLSKPAAAALAAYALIQIAVPLRHHVYDTDTGWDRSGDRFSWRMKLNARITRYGLFAVDPEEGTSRKIPLFKHLTPRQRNLISRHPALIVELARDLAVLESPSADPLEIHGVGYQALNGRPFQNFIKPSVDLASLTWWTPRSQWLYPNRLTAPWASDHMPRLESWPKVELKPDALAKREP